MRSDRISTIPVLTPSFVSSRVASLQAAFEALGLSTSAQSHSYTLGSSNQVSTIVVARTKAHSKCGQTGTNVYAILAAPKTDGAEAVVLSASWLSRAMDEDGRRRVNIRGVALVLALANYLKSQFIVIVVSRCD